MRAVIDSLFELGAAKQLAVVLRKIRRVILVPIRILLKNCSVLYNCPISDVTLIVNYPMVTARSAREKLRQRSSEKAVDGKNVPEAEHG